MTYVVAQEAANFRWQNLYFSLIGPQRAYLYGADDNILGGLNSFYLLVDQPEVYGLPRDPKLPSRNLFLSSIFSTLGAVVFGLFGLVSLRKRRMDEIAEGTRGNRQPRGSSDV